MLNFLSVEKSHTPHLKVWSIITKLDVSKAKNKVMINEWDMIKLVSKAKSKLCSAPFI